MLVGMWMTRELITISPGARASDAASAMARGRVRRLLVTGGGGPGDPLVGIVSARDVARAYPAGLNPFSAGALDVPVTRPVADLMSRVVVTITADAPIEDAARLLRARKIGAVPVLTGSRLVGIITESDVLRALIEVIGSEGVRVTFEVSESEDVVGDVLAVGQQYGMRVVSVLSVTHDGKHLGVTRLVGGDPDAFIEAIWRSDHKVLSVLRAT